jgi:catechol 2,3-dioxygenase-like lactoylglutathione lyase family enzyme
MTPRITVITLLVDDLARAVAFYRDGLGLPTAGIVGTQYAIGACAFFELAGGLKLAVWPRASARRDTGLDLPASGAGSVLIAHNVARRDDVDALLEQARAAGARIVKPAGPTFWGGHGGYFQDLDGHVWEVVFNPAWQIGPG